VAQEFSAHAWRTVLRDLEATVSPEGKTAIDRYCRLAFFHGRPRAWPSQEEGIVRLLRDGSFALCTPTGSGKTSVAEIALISAMFAHQDVESAFLHAPLAMYLVPSRALAAEVEGKLTTVFRRLSTQRTVVTGLYGGMDWGPTDAWLTVDEPTILICTYEKAEALIRFVGPLMLNRLSLVIFDEAHSVQYNGNVTELRDAESRPLRLESLGLRLSQLVNRDACRMIALSAVAAGIEESIQHWVSGANTGTPARVRYRSTRQLIGRLLVTPLGGFEIRYDLLDGHRMAFRDDVDATPYVPNPIPARPNLPTWTGPEKELRPALLWAALSFSAPDDEGRSHAVLISVMTKITGYAKDFLELLEQHWSNVLPAAHDISSPANPHADLIAKALVVADDYFGTTSYEYRLLKHGIAIHHSSMPKALTRLIIDLVQSRDISIVLATSTLSEGVNIPVETILLPSIHRGQSRLRTPEFRNLAGRAGRPGVATEGRTLVLMRSQSPGYDRVAAGYRELIQEVVTTTDETPRSSLATALDDIYNQWTALTGNQDVAAFLDWLETVTLQSLSPDQAKAFGCIDAIDNVLLSGLVECEELDGAAAWEERLRGLWNSSFAAQSASEVARLSFVRRGEALPQLFPGQDTRRRLYRTGLPPSTAYELLRNMPQIRLLLEIGEPYAQWDNATRLRFIESVVDEIGQIKRFKVPVETQEWKEILSWWLIHDRSSFPAPNKIADWHKNIHQWFGYRFCWGLGSVIGAAFEDVSGGEFRATTLDEWQQTGLPWITFWLKELIAWGTLEPVAAFLMSIGVVQTRSEAERQALNYYDQCEQTGDDVLDPRSIRDWTQDTFPGEAAVATSSQQRQVRAEVTDPSIRQTNRPYRVLPIIEVDGIGWIDAAGYILARSASTALNEMESRWDMFDFVLHPSSRQVTASAYL